MNSHPTMTLDCPTTSGSTHDFQNGTSFFQRSALYREFLAEREEILKLKWVESEKAGSDIGFECALVNWVVHHRAHWRKARRLEAGE